MGVSRVGGGWGLITRTQVIAVWFGLAVPSSSGGRCWVLVGLLVRSNDGCGAACQKPEIEPAWLGFWSAVLNSSVERWWILVRLFVRNDGDCGAHSQM